MTTISRFAPSPTGELHVGNLRTAIIAYFLAKKEENGKFILRIDDTDLSRSTEDFVKQLRQDLIECQLNWDEEFRQSERISRYHKIKDELIKSGRLYPCYETQEELQTQRQIAIKNNKPFIYRKNDINNKQFDADIKPHWRFELDRNKNISWEDSVRGEIKFTTSTLSDPIVIRADDSFTYLLISVIDDIDNKINYVIRGEDHVTNTASQIQMWEALCSEIPKFAHLALLKMPEGKISKRKGGFEIRQLLNEGIMPITLINYLSKLGSSKDIDSFKTSINKLITDFNIEDCSSSSPNFDKEILESLNLKIMRTLDFSVVNLFLKSKIQVEMDEELWDIIKNNLKNLDDISYWHSVCRKREVSHKFKITDELKNIAQLGLNFLSKDCLDLDTWKNWVDEICSENTTLIKKNVFTGLRIIITGRSEGPEMKRLVPLMGHNNLTYLLKNFLSCEDT